MIRVLFAKIFFYGVIDRFDDTMSYLFLFYTKRFGVKVIFADVLNNIIYIIISLYFVQPLQRDSL